jgi:hypothetical protein
MAKKLKAVWVLELDDTRGRYVLGVHDSFESCEDYVSKSEEDYDIVGYNECLRFRNGKGINYIATKYSIKSGA